MSPARTSKTGAEVSGLPLWLVAWAPRAARTTLGFAPGPCCTPAVLQWEGIVIEHA